MKKTMMMICMLLVAAFVFAACTPTEPMPTEQPPGQETLNPDESEEPAQQVEPPEITVSPDWESFEVQINSTVLSLPCALSELEALGWTLERATEGAMLGSNDYESVMLRNGDDNYLMGELINTTEDEIPLNEAQVGALEFDLSVVESASTFVYLPGGITFGSTYDDVVAAYGEPGEEEESGGMKSLTYASDTYSDITVYLNDEEEVDFFSIRHYDSQMQKDTPVENLPPEAEAYEPPEQLGSSWDSMTVKQADHIYALPAPMAEFLKNGWVLVDDAQTEIEARGYTSGVGIRNGNQEMWVSMCNYTDEDLPLTHCFVTSVMFSQEETRIPIELPGGITENSTREEIEAAYGKPDEVNDEEEEFQYLRYGDLFGEKEGELVFILSMTDGGKLWIIELQYQPVNLPYYGNTEDDPEAEGQESLDNGDGAETEQPDGTEEPEEKEDIQDES